MSDTKTQSTVDFILSSDILVPAIVALIVSGLTLFVTYLTSDRRAKYDAAFEAAKYREKWLSDIREEVVQFCSKALIMTVHQSDQTSVDDTKELITRRLRLQLSIPKSNQYYDDFEIELQKAHEMAVMGKAELEKVRIRPLIDISDKILQTEWDDIQQLLTVGIKKKKTKNVKN